MSALNNKPQQFYNAFQYSTDAIILTDAKGVITDVNKAFTSLFGWEKEEVLNQTTKILRSSGTADVLYEEMWNSITNNGKWKGEIINKKKDGTLLPVLLSITPILENDHVIGYMGIEIDISEKKQLEEKIARSERFSLIGQMAAKVAHEIRNPLSSISLNAELLGDEIKSAAFDIAEAESLLNSIMSEVDRLANLTNEYLQFSRLPKISTSECDLNKIFAGLSDLLDSELNNRNIKLSLDFAKKPVFVNADSDQIHRAFLNLIKNSIESLNADGNIIVKIRTLKETAQIDVLDDGQGIKEDQVSKIFDPFYTTKDIGTGLGLAISKQIIEDHGGSIEYINSSAPGAHFLIFLPK